MVSYYIWSCYSSPPNIWIFVLEKKWWHIIPLTYALSVVAFAKNTCVSRENEVYCRHLGHKEKTMSSSLRTGHMISCCLLGTLFFSVHWLYNHISSLSLPLNGCPTCVALSDLTSHCVWANFKFLNRDQFCPVHFFWVVPGSLWFDHLGYF